MSDVVSLGERRAERGNDARLWTPAEAARALLRDIESGAIAPRAIYVAMVESGPRGSSYPYITAGASNLEVCGLLAQHLQKRTAF